MSAIHPMCRVTTLCVAVPIWGVCRDSFTLVVGHGRWIPYNAQIAMLKQQLTGRVHTSHS